MKTCPHCKTELPAERFYADKRRPDGRRTYCKACDLAKSHAYQATNAAKIALQQQAYRADRAPIIKEKRASYRAAHLESEKSRRRRNYEKNKAAELARNAEYRQANAEAVLARKRERQREYVAERTDQIVAMKKEYFKEGSEQLKDWFVSRLIRARTELKPEDIPQGLIDAKREQLRILRELRKADHEERRRPPRRTGNRVCWPEGRDHQTR